MLAVFITLLTYSSVFASQIAVLLNHDGVLEFGSEGVDISHPRVIAWATFNDSVQETGWGNLHVHTRSGFSPISQARAAGMVEGKLTGAYMAAMFDNVRFINYPETGEYAQEVDSYIHEQLAWVEEKSQRLSGRSEYWFQVSLVIAQMNGLFVGAKGNGLSRVDIYKLNNDGDMQTLLDKFKVESKLSTLETGDEETFPLDFGSCSALIKITDDDVMVGHTTWSSFGSMLRIYKHYHFGFAPSMSFSAKPGLLSSKDDFYVLDSDLVVMETTNSVYNKNLLDKVQPQSIPSWIRVTVANRMADDGETWTSVFSRYQSGTYNNQWMVLDMKRKYETSGFLWIAEELPGLIVSDDVTEILLDQGFWASYNIPYFPEISEMSGATAKRQENDFYSYTKCSRARIFARDQSKVDSLESFQNLLRFNDWQNDPLSLGNPAYSISSRYDLLDDMVNATRHGMAFGGIDAKVTSSNLMTHAPGSSFAVCGPTTQQGVFSWKESSERFPKIPHYGHPISFDFKFEYMDPFSGVYKNPRETANQLIQ